MTDMAPPNRPQGHDAALASRLRDVEEQNALIIRHRAADRIEQLEALLDELRGAYDDFYSTDGPGRLHRLLNAEKLVRDARHG